MKRAIFTLVLLSCGPQPSPTQDAGFNGNFSLTPAEPWVLAVRGSSVTTHAALSVTGDPGTVTVAFGPLPDGLSSTPASWIALESPSIPLTITASADAPEMELNVDIHASVNGTVLASGSVHLTVSGVAGSVDTSFPLAADFQQPTRIGQLSDGNFIVTGWTHSNQVCAQRVAPDGAASQFVASGSNVQYASAAAISDTGLVAVAALDAGSNQIIEFDQGAVVTVLDAPLSISAMSFDGTSLFDASTTHLAYTATGVETVTAFTISSLETLGPGVVLAGGYDEIKTGTALVTFTASSTDITASVAHAIPGPYAFVTNTITLGGTTLVGLATQTSDVAVARVDAQGKLIDVRALPTGQPWANVRIAALPSGEPLLLGTRVLQNGGNAATLGIVQTFTPDFGVLGRALVRIEGPTTILDGVVDATGSYLYITGETGDTQHAYVARIRLTP